MDLDTGQVLYGKGEHERRPPASLTKVMTGYLAGKQFQTQQWITVVLPVHHILLLLDNGGKGFILHRRSGHQGQVIG